MTVEPRDPAQVRIEQGTDPAATERILRALPEWFGLEQSLLDYVEAAKRLPGHLARLGDDVVGVLLVERHFPTAAEIHLMAVDPAHHRAGIGRRLVAAAEAELAADGVRLLEVKTLGPSHPSEEYARTRRTTGRATHAWSWCGRWTDAPTTLSAPALPVASGYVPDARIDDRHDPRGVTCEASEVLASGSGRSLDGSQRISRINPHVSALTWADVEKLHLAS